MTLTTFAAAEKAAVNATRDVELRKAGLVEERLPDTTMGDRSDSLAEQRASATRHEGRRHRSNVRVRAPPGAQPRP